MLLSVKASFIRFSLCSLVKPLVKKTVSIIDRPSISSQTKVRGHGNNFTCAQKFLAENQTNEALPLAKCTTTKETLRDYKIFFADIVARLVPIMPA